MMDAVPTTPTAKPTSSSTKMSQPAMERNNGQLPNFGAASRALGFNAFACRELAIEYLIMKKTGGSRSRAPELAAPEHVGFWEEISRGSSPGVFKGADRPPNYLWMDKFK